MHVTETDPAADRLQPIGERTFQPLDDRVLVRRLPDPGNVSVILKPGDPPSKRGEVVAVGSGKRGSSGRRRPLAVSVGDVIYFGRYTDFDDGSLVLIQEADIVGIVS